MGQNVQDAILKVRSSTAREEIVRELYGQGSQRPSEFMDEVVERSGTSQANFYQSLSSLQGTVVDKAEMSGSRATLYSLTELGETVAEELGLDEPAAEPESESGPDPDAAGGAETVSSGQQGFAYESPNESVQQSERQERGPQSTEEARQQIRAAMSELSVQEITELLQEELENRSK